MFLCRRLLSLPHITKRASHIAILRVNSLNAAHLRFASPGFGARGLPVDAGQRATAPAPAETQDYDAIRDFLSGLSYDLSSHTQEPMYKGPRGRLSICDAYLVLRGGDIGLVASLPPAAYASVIRKAFAREMYGLMDRVVRDIMEVYDGNQSQRANMLRDILSTTDFTVLRRATILAMLHIVEGSTGGLDALPKPVVTNLVRMIIEDWGSDSADERLLHLTLKLLPAHIRCYRVPNGAMALVYNPSKLIHATFRLLQKVIPHFQEQAFNIFQDLVKTGQVPHEATQVADSSKHDFNSIIYSALIKASLHWGWRKLAYLLLGDLLASAAPDDLKTTLTIDAVYSFLDTPNGHDIEACEGLIRMAHAISPVPNGLVRQFYTGAMKAERGIAAEAMYEFTRKLDVLSTHRYPLPQGPALPWLMEHIAIHSRRDYLVQKLADEVLREYIPVPLQARAGFIGAVASKGHARLARALWERYSVGKDCHVVLGDSGLMVRMVSLLTNAIERLEEDIDSRGARDASASPVDLEDMSARLVDMRSFINNVILLFIRTHKPLATARHEALTSLARVCFIVEKFTEGFKVFNILLNRKELPDLYDVNVALSAMAEQHPHSASAFIERMREQGLRPDVVTYGTIMHHALAHGDSVLVEKMVGLVKELKDPNDQLKSATGLVRAIVGNGKRNPKDMDDAAFKAAQQERLQMTMEIIRSAMKSSSISSPFTGKYLIRVSLRAGDPVMAYRFWHLLVKDSADWEDKEHRGQRLLIAVSLIDHFKDRLPVIVITPAMTQVATPRPAGNNNDAAYNVEDELEESEILRSDKTAGKIINDLMSTVLGPNGTVKNASFLRYYHASASNVSVNSQISMSDGNAKNPHELHPAAKVIIDLLQARMRAGDG